MIKDISEEVRNAKAMVDSSTPTDHWSHYINWKDLMAEGVIEVKIDDCLYTFNKWGPELL